MKYLLDILTCATLAEAFFQRVGIVKAFYFQMLIAYFV